MLVSSLITLYLVYRFSRPIANLFRWGTRSSVRQSSGSRSGERRDEIGRLVTTFNEMASELLEKTRHRGSASASRKSAVAGRLGSAIAHEIRNPLNYINLTLDHLRAKFAPEDTDKKAKFEKLTGQLKAEVAGINQQISDFLNYSRTGEGRSAGHNVDVIKESLRIVEPEAAEKNVTIGVVEHEDVPAIMADPEFLRSVFNKTFLSTRSRRWNAAAAGHLSIKISPSMDREFVDFDISDTGGGISQDNLAKIFEPYFSPRRQAPVGLAIVQKIVELHHGTIAVVDVADGVGTKFTVKLPVAKRGKRIMASRYRYKNIFSKGFFHPPGRKNNRRRHTRERRPGRILFFLLALPAPPFSNEPARHFC